MKINLPFPNGHDIQIEKDLKIISRGIIDNNTEGRIITLKGFTELDILEIREIVIKDIKAKRDKK